MNSENTNEIKLRGDTYNPEQVEESIPESPKKIESATNEDLTSKRLILRKIRTYKSIFPEELNDIKEELQNIETQSLVELEATLVHVVFIVETRRSTHQARSLF